MGGRREGSEGPKLGPNVSPLPLIGGGGTITGLLTGWQGSDWGGAVPLLGGLQEPGCWVQRRNHSCHEFSPEQHCEAPVQMGRGSFRE